MARPVFQHLQKDEGRERVLRDVKHAESRMLSSKFYLTACEPQISHLLFTPSSHSPSCSYHGVYLIDCTHHTQHPCTITENKILKTQDSTLKHHRYLCQCVTLPKFIFIIIILCTQIHVSDKT